MQIPKRILISPLDWGMGHTSRCVPIIHLLQKQGATVLIACNAQQQKYLQQEVTNVQYITFDGYNIQYAKSKVGLIFKVIYQIPKIIASIIKEHKALDTIITNYNIDAVISDNRYGLYNKKITSVFITHQLFIKTPFAALIINLINHYLIAKFDECWIPDSKKDKNLSGSLSHKYVNKKLHAKFIGVLSRFNNVEVKPSIIPNSILLILSGVEPQKTILKNIIENQLDHKQYTLSIVGLEYITSKKQVNKITYHPILNSIDLQQQILTHEIIIARSGYSSAMDLAVLAKRAIMIATPGQAEQEYLASYYQQQKIHIAGNQKSFSLHEALANLKQLNNTPINAFSNTELDYFLRDWLRYF